MKIIKTSLIAVLSVALSFYAQAQNNTYPWVLTGSIGIGTASPAAKLHVVGTGTTYATSPLLIQNSSNTELLKILDNGTTYLKGPLGITDGQKMILDIGGDEWTYLMNDVTNTNGFGANTVLFSMGDNGNMVVTDAGIDPKFQIKDGNVFVYNKLSIGEFNMTKVGTHKLAVNGSALFTKAFVKLNSAWPDYVFEDTFRLTPLAELEKFVKLNKHLPGIVTANDVLNDGIDLGENQANLLKKVEELTLYVIEQNKKIETLEKQNEELKKMQLQLDELKKLLVQK